MALTLGQPVKVLFDDGVDESPHRLKLLEELKKECSSLTEEQCDLIAGFAEYLEVQTEQQGESQ